jgi:hypothetical protein
MAAYAFGLDVHEQQKAHVLIRLYEFSEGIPRRINLICSRLLLSGFLGESRTITLEDAQAVVQELRDAELAHPQAAGSDRSWPRAEQRGETMATTDRTASARQ